MKFNQGIGGAFHRTRIPQCAQQAPDQGGFARTQVAVESNDQPRSQATGQTGAQGQGGGLVGQKEAGGLIHNASMDAKDSRALADRIKEWGRELGLADLRIGPAELPGAAADLDAWLAAGCQGGMDYMAAHGTKRARPCELIAGTRAVITARLDYRPDAADAWENLAAGERAYVSRYALGRDYHKVMRQRLQRLADRIVAAVGPVACRVFVDSAPVMEVALARQSGLGWRGKHTLLLTRDAGSWFFLGEIYTDLPLPPDSPAGEHCGTCQACIETCPTGAIVGPYRLDARRCISYLTIELKGSIPDDLRPLIGNRVYGCDDCQLICPWNRFAPLTGEADFAPRHGLDQATLVELFSWSEADFESRLAGSPIRRIGYERWLRNLAVGLGNAATSSEVLTALASRAGHPSELVREHVSWALARHAGP